MRKIFYKILFLFMVSFFLVCPNVYAETPTPTSPYENLEDLGSLHIEMDANDNVSIKEIKEIQGKESKTRMEEAWNFTFFKYKGVIAGITGICTLTFILIFLITFVKISSSTSNPHQRAELTKALIWIGIGAAGFGAVTLFLSLGFGLFKETEKVESLIWILNNFI